MEKDILEKQLESIKELEDQLVNAESINKKNRIKLKLHKELLKIKRIVPYLVITGVTFAGCSSFFSIPFYRENKTKNLWYKKEIDSLGNKVIEEQYEKYDNVGEVSFVSKWKKFNDEYYSRSIITYSVNTLTEEEIERIINEEDLSLRAVLGAPISHKVEKKNNLTKEEINQEEFIRAIIYNKDDEVFIVEKESSKDNNLTTILFILLSAVSGFIYYSTSCNRKAEEKRSAAIHDLEEKYEEIDIYSLKRKLEIRKETYERLR